MITTYFDEKELYSCISSQEYNDVKFCHMDNFIKLVCLMQTVRIMLGKPMYITSWFRNYEHNRRVGGVPTSQHLSCAAFDFQTCLEPKTVVRLLNTVDYGQLIIYPTFYHISLPIKGRKRQTIYKL